MRARAYVCVFAIYLYVCGKQINNVVKRNEDWILRFYAQKSTEPSHIHKGKIQNRYRSNSNDFISFRDGKKCQTIFRCCSIQKAQLNSYPDIFENFFSGIFSTKCFNVNPFINSIDTSTCQSNCFGFACCWLCSNVISRMPMRKLTTKNSIISTNENIIIDFFCRLMRETYSWNRTVDRFIDERTAEKKIIIIIIKQQSIELYIE